MTIIKLAIISKAHQHETNFKKTIDMQTNNVLLLHAISASESSHTQHNNLQLGTNKSKNKVSLRAASTLTREHYCVSIVLRRIIVRE